MKDHDPLGKEAAEQSVIRKASRMNAPSLSR
jgi:hypothetical protein